jgi:hypothetical protein
MQLPLVLDTGALSHAAAGSYSMQLRGSMRSSAPVSTR